MNALRLGLAGLAVAVALGCSGSGAALAAARAAPQPVVVEAVQMPAWIDRGTAGSIPVHAGMAVNSGDLLRTGPNARLQLRLAEGSAIKLGEHARLRVEEVQMRPGGVFAGSIQVLQGAFRFTTDALLKLRGRREIDFRLASVTAGIRGTDLWGKSVPDREVFCLIEGTVEVTPKDEKPLLLDQPLQFYVRDRGESQPVGVVDPAQLRLWAAETEIEIGKGVQRRNGRWKVTLATAGNQTDALKLYDDIRAAGYPATILPVEVEGRTEYRLRLTGLPSRAEAEALAAALKGRPGMADPKVSM